MQSNTQCAVLSANIGIDVGGTNTDAVLLVNNFIQAQCKTPTTPDITQGIVTAVKRLLEQKPDLISSIDSVMLGTTHLLNALHQNQLDKVAVIRLAAPATTAIPPLSGWPTDLRKKIDGTCYIVKGGYEFDGRLITALDKGELDNIAKEITQNNILTAAIIGLFSHVNPDQEEKSQALLKLNNPNLLCSLSHKNGGLGLIERENATILNASLMRVYQKISNGIMQALQGLGLKQVKLFLSHNDGTIAPEAQDHSQTSPILTLNSGSANSIRGGGVLAQVTNAIVVDIGGTTTDVGVLSAGFPLEQTSLFKIAGVCCNFANPLTQSIALGGGSIITLHNNEIIIGPNSLGHELTEKAIIFGGKQLTFTDIAFAKGRLNFQDADLSKLHAIDPNLLDRIDNLIHYQLSQKILAVLAEIKEKPKKLLLVGGGAVLVCKNKLLTLLNNKFEDAIIPQHSDVANAVGAATALLRGHHSGVYDYANTTRNDAIHHAMKCAKNAIIIQGADPNSIRTKRVYEQQIKYLTGNPNYVDVTVVAELSADRAQKTFNDQSVDIPPQKCSPTKTPETLDLAYFKLSELTQYKLSDDMTPPLSAKVSLLGPETVRHLALGCSFLGAGGGGDIRFPKMIIDVASKQGKQIKLLTLENLPNDATVIVFGNMGSPCIIEEKIPSRQELVQVIKIFEEKLDKKIVAIMPGEIGGGNGLFPLIAAAELGLPVLDADCLGRALPNINMATPYIYAHFEKYVAVLANAKHATVITADNPQMLENKARAATVAMGGIVYFALMPMDGKTAKRVCVADTVSIACEIGRRVDGAKKQCHDPLVGLNRYLMTTEYQHAKILFTGQVSDLHRLEEGGFSIGGIVIENGIDKAIVGFQNEHLILQIKQRDGTMQTIAQVPDLITIVNHNTFVPISCGQLRRGQKIAVLTMRAPQKISTPTALAIVGPQVFPIQQILALMNDAFEPAKISVEAC